MKSNSQAFRRRWARIGVLCVLAVGVTGAAAGVAAGSGGSKKAVKIAYLSFAVANSYDAPMLAAAQKAAKAAGATTITVQDANNSPTTQLNQLQTVASSHQYNAIIVQPIFGTGLITTVQAAIKSGIKVVNMDQELGPNLSTDKPQVAGLSGNVVFVPTEIGKKLGKLALQACTAHHLNPCNIGYLDDIKASALDVALSQAFGGAIAGHSTVSIVAEGQDFFTPSIGPGRGPDDAPGESQHQPHRRLRSGNRGCGAGGRPARRSCSIGYGASVAGHQGRRFGDVVRRTSRSCRRQRARMPCSAPSQAVRTGKGCGGVDPVAKLPNGGVVTKANVSKFHGEWPG